MKLKYRLLDHPFYQSWSSGKVTDEQLSRYASSYLDFIREIPNYWQKCILGLNASSEQAQIIINEECSHITLWEEFASKLPDSEDYPVMNDLLNAFRDMSPSELLGAIHSFEIQQPEVAKTKMNGLIKFYGFSFEEVKYFDAHLHEDEHIKFGSKLMSEFANIKEFQHGFEVGAELIYKSLDLFLN